MSLTVDNPDAGVKTQPMPDSRVVLYHKTSTMSSKEIISLVNKASSEGKKYMKDMLKAESMNMGMSMNSMAAETASLDRQENDIKDKYSVLSKQLKKAKKDKDREKYRAISKELQQVKASMNDLRKLKSMKKNSGKFARASEIESPAKANHFLRRFGQSDREIIDGGSKEPSVPQALTLLNGQVEDYITANSVSSINRNMKAAKTHEEKIDTAFMSILSRSPKDSEKSMFKAMFNKDEEQAAKDLIWVLINSNEFMFLK